MVKLLKKGKDFFFPIDDFDADKLNPHFLPDKDPCFRKLSMIFNVCFYPESLLEADRRLEDSVRICDTRGYLDTLNVASYLLEDGEAFLKLMEVVTRGSFLSTPCYVKLISKNWVWDTPKWFTGMGYYSLGTFIAHKLEQALWMRYWEAFKIDPRASDPEPSLSKKLPGSRITTKSRPLPSYQFPKYHEGLLTKSHLINFWKNTAPQDRRKIVGSIGEIVVNVIMKNDQGDTKEEESDYWGISLLSVLVQISWEEKNLELFENDKNHEKTFVEILYFSPLKRAGTPIDMILRRIGLCIQSAYSEKLSMDLIMGEEAEKVTKAAQAEAKSKKRRKRNLKAVENKNKLRKK